MFTGIRSGNSSLTGPFCRGPRGSGYEGKDPRGMGRPGPTVKKHSRLDPASDIAPPGGARVPLVGEGLITEP